MAVRLPRLTLPLPRPARAALVDVALHEVRVEVHRLRLFLEKLVELADRKLRLAARFAQRLERRPQELAVADARKLDGILERKEDPLPRALVGEHTEDALALEENVALRDRVARPSGDPVRERALAAAVRPHTCVHLAEMHRKVHPF